MDPMHLAVWGAGPLLVVGALGALYRIARGPSLLDRAIATDVLLVVLSSMLILDMAARGHTDTVVLVVLAATVGFVGSVTVARFVEDSRPDHSLEDQARVPGTTDVPGGEEAR